MVECVTIFKLRLGALIPRSVGWSVGRSVGRSVGWSVGRSVGQSVGRSVHPKNYKKIQNFTKPLNTWLSIKKKFKSPPLLQ